MLHRNVREAAVARKELLMLEECGGGVEEGELPPYDTVRVSQRKRTLRVGEGNGEAAAGARKQLGDEREEEGDLTELHGVSLSRTAGLLV